MKKGISLIVLVITIIVMIVLAGTIIISLSDSSVFSNANKAVEVTDKKQVEELSSVAWSEAYLNGARTQEQLKSGVIASLKSSGIPVEDYIFLVTRTGTQVLDANSWDHAYTCTNGEWSTRIEKGNPLTGDIVARFYKTGNKMTVSQEVLQMLAENGITVSAEQDEYRLVITGEGAIGMLVDEEQGKYNAWMLEMVEAITGTRNTSVLISTTELIMAADVENAGEFLFQFFFSLKDATITDAATSVGDYMFIETYSLENVKILSDITSIGSEAFWACNKLKSITLPNSLTSIEYGAFGQCESLNSITIPEGVKSIGESAFNTCTNLKSIILPSSLTSIENDAFAYCYNLTSVKLPNSLTSVENYLFRNCSGLKEVTIPKGITRIGIDAFYGCTNLKNITLPMGVVNIESYAFRGCSALETITIPSTVTNIGGSAFYNCANLKTVNYTGSEEQWSQITIGYMDYEFYKATKNYNYVMK